MKNVRTLVFCVILAAVAAAGFCSETAQGYSVAVETTMRKVFKDDVVKNDPSPVAKLSSARGGSDGAQILISVGSEPLTAVKVTAGNLIAVRGKSRIKSSQIEVLLVGYVKTEQPRYEVRRVGWWPDPLLPLTPFNVAANEVQPIWVNVKVPLKAKAGDYEGKITIQPSNAAPREVKLRLTVWDFSLPVEPHFKTWFGLRNEDRFDPEWRVVHDALSSYYNELSPREIDETLRRYCFMMLDHKITPANPVDTYVDAYHADYERADKLLGECMKRGLTCFGIGYFTPKYPIRWPTDEGFRKYLKDYSAHLKEKGWLSKACFYSWDEPTLNDYPPGGVQESFQKIKHLTSIVRSVCPDLKILLTSKPTPELFGAVDIWVPITQQFDREQAKARLKAGDEMWWYTCNWPHRPYANLLIDEPAIDHRILFWQSWNEDVTGFLDWAIDFWGPNNKGKTPAEKWPSVPWNPMTCELSNGDGHLIYPGPGGIPYSSIRLECVRDGVEDYEYFWQLNDRLTKLRRKYPGGNPAIAETERLLEATHAIAPSLTEYTEDPSHLRDCREHIGRQIETVDRLLAGSR